MSILTPVLTFLPWTNGLPSAAGIKTAEKVISGPSMTVHAHSTSDGFSIWSGIASFEPLKPSDFAMSVMQLRGVEARVAAAGAQAITASKCCISLVTFGVDP